MASGMRKIEFYMTLCMVLAGLVSQSYYVESTTSDVWRASGQFRARKSLNYEEQNSNSTTGSGSNTTSAEESMTSQNEIDDRITIGEPYKSLIQTTARFALAQTKLTEHVKLDTAMSFINDAGYFLAKPSVLVKVMRLFAVTVATFVASAFFFPGAYKFVDAVWQDPYNALNLDRYLTNGLQERSVLAMLGTKTDEAFSSVGLQDYSCRERSICYMGEILKCSFPHTADSLTKFVSENFASSNLKEHVLARAFTSGFVDRNCSYIGRTNAQETQNCLSNFFNSILTGSPTHTRHDS